MHQKADKLSARDFTAYKKASWNNLAKDTALKAKFPLSAVGTGLHLWCRKWTIYHYILYTK